MQPKSSGDAALFSRRRALALVTAGLSLTGGLALLLLAGCPGAAPTPPLQPHDEVTLAVACPDPTAETLIKERGAGWESEQHAHLETVRYDPEAGPEGTGADVWVVAPWRLPRRAAADALLPVPEALTARDAPYKWEGLLPLFRNKLLGWDRTAYAVPLGGDSLVCFYRSDLLGADGKGPPATWEEFADLAKAYHGRPELGGFSLPPLPAADDDLDREFFAVAAPFVRRAYHEEDPAPGETELFSFHFDLTTMEPRLASPGFVHALALLRRLREYRPAGTAAAPAKAFAEGKAALCLADASWAKTFQGSDKVRDRFGVCPVPGSGVVFSFEKGEPAVEKANRMPYVGAGGWLAVVPRETKHADAAWDLLAELTGPTASRQIAYEPRYGAGPFRKEHFEHFPVSAFGLDGERGKGLVEGLRQQVEHHGLTNPVLRLRIPEERAYQRALLEGLRPALAGDVEPDKALEAVAAKWRELGAKKDVATRRAEYLRSLSLHSGEEEGH
jgi:multiple sugar transport system substrate-binding protein